MVHESYLSDKDYPYWEEHMLAPTFEQLAGTVEQVEACVRELPLLEAAEILGPMYSSYLLHMCRIHTEDATQALPYAEALVATAASSEAINPGRSDLPWSAWSAEAEARVVRLHYLGRLTQPDYAAILDDCYWLLRKPLEGVGHWLDFIARANPECSPAEWWDWCSSYEEEDRQWRTGCLLIAAWAHYRQGDVAAATTTFARAFEFAPSFTHSFGKEWEPSLLPPVPDAAYLTWQIDQQLAERCYNDTPPGIRHWLGEALRWLKKQQAD